MVLVTTSSLVSIETPDGPMPARLVAPAEPNGAGVVVFQEIFGVSDYILRRCADLAALGYTVVAPEFYWRLDDRAIDESAEDVLAQAMALVSRLDWPSAVQDGVAALDWLRAQPQVTGRVALLGFCFGGGLAFNVAAQRTPDALVSYYGSALPGLLDLAPQVTCPSLHHFGLADTFIPADTVEQIKQAVTAVGPQVSLLTYAGAGHAFDNPNPMFFHAEASQRAWLTTTAWLAAQLSNESDVA